MLSGASSVLRYSLASGPRDVGPGTNPGRAVARHLCLSFLLCSATTLPLRTPSDELRCRDAGAKLHTARRKSRHHIAKVVNTKVHPAKTDQEYQQTRPEDDGCACPPGSQR